MQQLDFCLQSLAPSGILIREVHVNLRGGLIKIRCAVTSRGFCLKARESQCGERQYHQSISSVVQYVTLQKKFSHPRLFSYLLSFNSTHKTKNGMQIGGRLTTNSNTAGPIKRFSQSTVGVKLCCAFY